MFSNTVMVQSTWKGSISFYPNPLVNDLTIQSDIFSGSETIEIEVSDVTGKRVLTQKVDAQNGAVKVDFRNLPSGIYLVDCLMEGSSTGKRKIVKQ